MDTYQELESLQEAMKIIQQARYATANGARPIYLKVLHAGEWIEKQVERLLAEETIDQYIERHDKTDTAEHFADVEFAAMQADAEREA